MPSYIVRKLVVHKLISHNCGRSVGFSLRGDQLLRNETKGNIAKVVRNLNAGYSPKMIAMRLGVGWECVKAIINRHPEVRKVYVDTHHLRYPHKEHPPLKIVSPLH